MKSIPYYDTRAYVNAVMRNYLMYQIDYGGLSGLTSMVQGPWPKFPGMRVTGPMLVAASAVRSLLPLTEVHGGN